jgi:magnesium transporter
MPESVPTMAEKAALAPGTLIHVGEAREEPGLVHLVQYDREFHRETKSVALEQLEGMLKPDGVNWIRVEGIHDVNLVQKIGTIFRLHPLVLEDVTNTHQRPKYEDYENYLFLVLKDLELDSEQVALKSRQISLILGANYVISFVEGDRGDDPLEAVARRIEAGRKRIRRMGPDYLVYALVDAVVDEYFKLEEDLGEMIDTLEEQALTDPGRETLQMLYRLKRSNLKFRKSVRPLRELAASLVRGESELITDGIKPFVRDVYDHTIHVIDAAETLRDVLAALLDIYLSSMSNRMNEIMKLLTTVATMFIPLTFLAGVYGMNFKNMPELEWKWGYPLVLLVMASIVAAMLLLFRRKKWL